MWGRVDVWMCGCACGWGDVWMCGCACVGVCVRVCMCVKMFEFDWMIF